MPIKGKRSSIVSTTLETRADVRTVATINEFYMSMGVRHRSISGLVSAIIEDFASLLIDNDKAEFINTTLKAKEAMERHFGKATNRRGSNLLLKTIRIEEASIVTGEVGVEDDRQNRADEILRQHEMSEREDG